MAPHYSASIVFLYVKRGNAMGKMIECKFCTTLLPDDSYYCYHCGNSLENDLEADKADMPGAPEHFSEEEI